MVNLPERKVAKGNTVEILKNARNIARKDAVRKTRRGELRKREKDKKNSELAGSGQRMKIMKGITAMMMAVSLIFSAASLQANDDRIEYIKKSFKSHEKEFVSKAEVLGSPNIGVLVLSKEIENKQFLLNVEHVEGKVVAETAAIQIKHSDWTEFFIEEIRYNYKKEKYVHRLFHYEFREADDSTMKSVGGTKQIWDEVIEALFSKGV